MSSKTSAALDNPFWQFSVACYAAPDMAKHCLAWQEQYQLDVNMLLFCGYLHYQQLACDADFLRSCLTELKPIQTQIRELRQQRQALKNQNEVAYQAAKMHELAQEQRMQAVLYQRSLALASHSSALSLIDYWQMYFEHCNSKCLPEEHTQQLVADVFKQAVAGLAS